MLFFSFELNYTAAFYLRRLPYLKIIMLTESWGLISSAGCAGLIWLQIISYPLFDLTKSYQFNFILTINPECNVWLCLWFNRTVQTAFTELGSMHPYFTMLLLDIYLHGFWQQTTIYCLNSAEPVDLFILVYRIT